jgi:predicted dehydrogenase
MAHLPALRNHPRFEPVALASPSSAAAVAREQGLIAFASCEAMLEGCALDVVTVASPPFAHCQDVLASLAAGKHVLCEKPFALDVPGAQRMVDAAKAAGSACGVSHEFRFVPQIQALGELAHNGHLGPLRDIEITLLRPTLRATEQRERGWWFERKRGGGLAGAVLSHLIDQSNTLAGRSQNRAVGLRRTANPQRVDERGEFTSTVDDGAFALLDYGDGLVARLCVDGTTAVGSYTFAVHGEMRTAVASGPAITEVTLYAIDGDVTEELTCTPSPFAAYEKINGNVPLLMELYTELAKRIDGEPNALPTFEEALATQRALAAAGYGATSSR